MKKKEPHWVADLTLFIQKNTSFLTVVIKHIDLRL